ncbi:MAG: PolC-type DNA polymerase III, partial [bacterium]|nr:PolC-type DNA polymerase III [bacterium]
IDVTTIPMDDPQVISLLTSPKALGVTEDEIMCPTGTLGLPEMGTRFVINMLVETQPKSFGELVKISGLSHGTDVWAGNASELIANHVCPFKEVIGCRDDIMVNLMNWGMKPIRAFKIMEFVRKGKASKDPETWQGMAEEMRQVNIPEWYIESCRKIKYMFPKAHAVAYVMSALRIAWFKVYHPAWYYAAYFSIRIEDFDIESMIKGYSTIKKKIEDLTEKGFEASNKETSVLETLKAALETTARGIQFGPIDINRSQALKFIIDDDNQTLIPPFRCIDGLGDTVANNIVAERESKPFLSIEDLQKRAKVSQTLIDKMRMMGILNDLPESSQMTLF